jgi:hypothetical protein
VAAQRRRREHGVHAQLLGELVRLGRLWCAPDLLQASDVWLEGREGGQDPAAALTPAITKAPPQVPRHHPQLGRLLHRRHQPTSSSVASWSQAVCLQAITVGGGAEHSIGLMPPRMLGGRRWVGWHLQLGRRCRLGRHRWKLQRSLATGA